MTEQERIRNLEQAVGAREPDGALGWLKALIADHERLRNDIDAALEAAEDEAELNDGDDCIPAPLALLRDEDPSATAEMLRECRGLADALERLLPGEEPEPVPPVASANDESIPF